MNKYPLSVAIPTCTDFSGCIFTVRNIIDTDAFDEGKIDIIVVDNTPEAGYRAALKNQITAMGPHVRYVEHTVFEGPASTKNRGFKEAKGEYVLCIDGHVVFKRGIIDRLVEFVENLPEDKKDDFFTGPLLNNNGNISTHFSDVIRNQMLGIWTTDKDLLKDDELKPIWGQGCGLMLTRRESWLGFNPNFRAFGAEEGYIHEKYRKAGKEVWLIPWLLWWHRFGNPDTKHYALTRYGKVRNYVLGHQELGQSLDRIYSHFVDDENPKDVQELRDHLVAEHSVPKEKVDNMDAEQLREEHKKHKLPLIQWEHILADPIKNDKPKVDIVDDFYQAQKNSKHNDLSQHFEMMVAKSKNAKIIGDITRRSLSITPALKVAPEKIVSLIYGTRPIDPSAPFMQKSPVEIHEKEYREIIDNIDTLLPECDTLYFQYPHECKTTVEDIFKVVKNVKNNIIIRETRMGYRSEITNALKALVNSGEWFVDFHTNEQWGSTVLSRTKPEKPVRAWLPNGGVGSNIKKLLKKIGIEAPPGCSCNKKATMYDIWGPAKCRENIEVILDGLQEEAKRQHKPFIRLGAKALVKLAIRQAEKQEKLESNLQPNY